MTLVGYELSKPIRRLHGWKSWLAVATAIVSVAANMAIGFGAGLAGAYLVRGLQRRRIVSCRCVKPQSSYAEDRRCRNIICLKCNDLVTLSDPFCQTQAWWTFQRLRSRADFCESRNAPCMCRTLLQARLWHEVLQHGARNSGHIPEVVDRHPAPYQQHHSSGKFERVGPHPAIYLPGAIHSMSHLFHHTGDDKND